jgi:hypothetical protein
MQQVDVATASNIPENEDIGLLTFVSLTVDP